MSVFALPRPSVQDDEAWWAARLADPARRLPALPGRWGRSLAARDPLLPWPAVRQPSTFGLTATELRHEAQRLLAAGWQVHEVVAVLAAPEADAA